MNVNWYLVAPFIALAAASIYVYFDVIRNRKQKKEQLHNDVTALLEQFSKDESAQEPAKDETLETKTVVGRKLFVSYLKEEELKEPTLQQIINTILKAKAEASAGELSDVEEVSEALLALSIANLNKKYEENVKHEIIHAYMRGFTQNDIARIYDMYATTKEKNVFTKSRT